MTRIGRKTRAGLALACCAFATIVVSVGAQAAGTEKVALCHGTASASNPWVLIRVSVSALEGHFDGTAPGHGQNNHPDFVAPVGAADCSDGDGTGDGGGGDF